jgi:hypothetical protein
MFEVNNPPTDSTWLDSQDTIRDQLSSLDANVAQTLRTTARAVYLHPGATGVRASSQADRLI